MSKLKFTKEETTTIKKAMNIALDDIRELWKTAQTEEITITVADEMGSREFYYLIINDNAIYLSDIIFDDKWFLETKAPLRGVKRSNDVDVSFKFINSYEKIRKEIEAEIKKGIRKKGLGFEALEEVKRKYDKEALIEINLPESNNQHLVEVTEENGRTIGTIDFGNRSIRIITDGDIALVNRPSNLPKLKKR